ncbi:MAG: hypothetical protein JO199_07560 [Candidatus Eremiobacteraeota bacterium]|nr:hypothetical protein [Candidatus Eremiobacteraeota bacterium]
MSRLKFSLMLAAFAAFCGFFFYAKHAPGLRDVVPFGDDPYDAVGSYAAIAGPLLVLCALCYWRSETAMRAALALVLVDLWALVADAVAMVRHWPLWGHSPYSPQLIAYVTCAALVQLLVLGTFRSKQRYAPSRNAIALALSISALSMVVLALYPEQLIERLDTHVLTIVAAAVLLFAPVRYVLEAIWPPRDAAFALGKWRGFTIAGSVGFLAGALAFAGEISDGVATQHLLLVGSVFVGLGAAGVLIGYAFLARPIGLHHAHRALGLADPSP